MDATLLRSDTDAVDAERIIAASLQGPGKELTRRDVEINRRSSNVWWLVVDGLSGSIRLDQGLPLVHFSAQPEPFLSLTETPTSVKSG